MSTSGDTAFVVLVIWGIITSTISILKSVSRVGILCLEDLGEAQLS